MRPIRQKPGSLLGYLTRTAFAALSAMFMLLAVCILAYAAWQTLGIFSAQADIGTILLNAVGFTVISLAVFEVAKYIFEEEVLDPRERHHAREARRGITKFISTIAIAIFLEALVLVFATGKDDVSLMLYPVLLLFAGIGLMVGLGAYQHLSVSAERHVHEPETEPEPERTAAPESGDAGKG